MSPPLLFRNGEKRVSNDIGYKNARAKLWEMVGDGHPPSFEDFRKMTYDRRLSVPTFLCRDEICNDEKQRIVAEFWNNRRVADYFWLPEKVDVPKSLMYCQDDPTDTEYAAHVDEILKSYPVCEDRAHPGGTSSSMLLSAAAAAALPETPHGDRFERGNEILDMEWYVPVQTRQARVEPEFRFGSGRTRTLGGKDDSDVDGKDSVDSKDDLGNFDGVILWNTLHEVKFSDPFPRAQIALGGEDLRRAWSRTAKSNGSSALSHSSASNAESSGPDTPSPDLMLKELIRHNPTQLVGRDPAGVTGNAYLEGQIQNILGVRFPRVFLEPEKLIFRDASVRNPVYKVMTKDQEDNMRKLLDRGAEMTPMMERMQLTRHRLEFHKEQLKFDLDRSRIEIARMQQEQDMRRVALVNMKQQIRARQLRMVMVYNKERESAEFGTKKFRLLGTELLPPDTTSTTSTSIRTTEAHHDTHYDKLERFDENVFRNDAYRKHVAMKNKSEKYRQEKKKKMRENLRNEQNERLALAKREAEKTENWQANEDKRRKEREARIETKCGQGNDKSTNKRKMTPMEYKDCREKVLAELGREEAKMKMNISKHKKPAKEREFDFLKLGDKCKPEDHCWMDEFLLRWVKDSPWGAIEGQNTITSVRKFETRGREGPSPSSDEMALEIAFDGSTKDRKGESIQRLRFHYFEGADPDMVTEFWDAAVERAKRSSFYQDKKTQSTIEHLREQWIVYRDGGLYGPDRLPIRGLNDFLDEREEDLQEREGGRRAGPSLSEVWSVERKSHLLVVSRLFLLSLLIVIR